VALEVGLSGFVWVAFVDGLSLQEGIISPLLVFKQNRASSAQSVDLRFGVAGCYFVRCIQELLIPSKACYAGDGPELL
jgi:hypothetical protein